MPEWTSPASSYVFGSINTQESTYNGYRRYGLKSRDGQILMHEYGHYLVEKGSGAESYYGNDVLKSLWNYNTMSDEEYRSSSTELKANTRAFEYFGRPSYWDFKNFPVYCNWSYKRKR